MIVAGVAILALSSAISLTGIGIPIASAGILVALLLIAVGIMYFFGNEDEQICKKFFNFGFRAYLGTIVVALGGVVVGNTIVPIGVAAPKAKVIKNVFGGFAALVTQLSLSDDGLFSICKPNEGI